MRTKISKIEFQGFKTLLYDLVDLVPSEQKHIAHARASEIMSFIKEFDVDKR